MAAEDRVTSRERRGTRYLVRLLRKRGCVSMGDVADAAWRATARTMHSSSDACDAMLRRIRRHGRIMPGFYGMLTLTRPTYHGSILLTHPTDYAVGTVPVPVEVP